MRVVPFLTFSGICGAPNVYLFKPDDVRNMTSPGFPYAYPPDVSCSWVIIGRDEHRISIRIHRLMLERDFDVLTMGHGNNPKKTSFVRLTGTTAKLRIFTSEDSAMWMTFITDNVVSMEGFFVEVKQVVDETGENNGITFRNVKFVMLYCRP